MANMSQICSRESCLLEDYNGWPAGLVYMYHCMVYGGEKGALSQRNQKKVMYTVD